MKKIIFIFNLLLLFSSLGAVSNGQTISLFNFNGSSIDENDTESAKLKKQISNHFIDLMKRDEDLINKYLWARVIDLRMNLKDASYEKEAYELASILMDYPFSRLGGQE